MPAPATIDQLLELAEKSGVVDQKRLVAYVEGLLAAPEVPDTPPGLAAAMVRDGLLTHFQAQQLLLGKSRRFILGNKYRLLEELGQGGMGSVYLCEHLMLRRRVAVKVLPPSCADDAAALERFYREARAVAAIDHPNIVRAHDVDSDGKLHYLVMEYVDGSNLQDVVKKHGPMDVLRACHYVRQSAVGLQKVHEAGLVHRDVKPGNILLNRSGVIKLLDMGLARFFNDDDDQITRKHDETVLGTTDYLAPEQAIDGNVDVRADIYSLGATFYFLLTGRTPFADGTIAQKLIWHQTRMPKPMRTLRPEVPEGVAAIVEKMMAKDPAERYQVPIEVAEALAPWTETPIGPPPEKEMPSLCPAVRAACRSELTLPPGSSPPASRRPTAAGTPRPGAQSSRPVSAPKSNGTQSRRPVSTGSSPVCRPKTAPEVDLGSRQAVRDTSTSQAAIDTAAPAARADTEPTQARKRPATALQHTPGAGTQTQKPARKPSPGLWEQYRPRTWSRRTMWTVAVVSCVLGGLLLWFLLIRLG